MPCASHCLLGLGTLGHGAGDTQLAPRSWPPGKGVQKGSRQPGLCLLQTLVRVLQCGVSTGDPLSPLLSCLCRVGLVCWGWGHHQGSLQDARAGI